MSKLTLTKGIRTFTLIWFGQLISLTGSGLTSFALGVWVFQQTDSVTLFSLISLFTTLPGILISPLAGVLIDRWDKRWAMLLSDAGAGLSILALMLLLWFGQLKIWHIYLVVGISSTFNTLQWSALSAATTLLVPKEQLGRASGMVQFADATAQTISPTLAAILVATLQLKGLLLVDVASFIFSLVTLLLVRFPKLETTIVSKAKHQSLLHEFAVGWTFIKERPGLLGLMIFFVTNNLVMGIVIVLIQPLVLAFTSVTMLGIVMSIGGCGMIVGSLLMSLWGGGKRRIYNLFNFTFLGGLCILFAGLRPNVNVFFFTIFFYFFGMPLTAGSSQAIWQSKVPIDLQGRVFSIRRMIALASFPLAYAIAGPLADQIFKPLLKEGGLLSESLGGIFGVGEGYGIALLFIVLGILTMLVAGGAYFYPHLRRVEDELPDATPNAEQKNCTE
jgi:MFS transporter, DHA3 family, macrolide efflux protein